MDKIQLKPFNNFSRDFLFWIKSYLIHKSKLICIKKDISDDNVSKHITLIENTENFAQLRSECSILFKNKLKTSEALLSSLTKFHTFVETNTNCFESIDEAFMQSFLCGLDLAETTKWIYVENIVDFLMYIENTNDASFKFQIDYKMVRLKKPGGKEYDVLTPKEMQLFSDALATIKFKNEFEKSRAILICRIMLYSGITPKELSELKLGKNLIVDKKRFCLRLENREVDIDLPRSKLFDNFLVYSSLKEENCNGFFFYSIRNKDKYLIAEQVNALVKVMLEKANIKKDFLGATLLRASFAVFLHRHRQQNKQYHINAIQKILGQTRREDTEKMIGFFKKNYTQVSHLFE